MLKLDWNIEESTERVAAIHRLLASGYTPTPTETETLSRYILWGKDSSGKTGRQQGLYIPSNSNDWATDSSTTLESLEALLESPTFSENQLKRPEEPAYKTPRRNLSRQWIRKAAPPNVLEEFERLWREIDETELQLNLYEVSTGKRTKPPRDQLLARFTPDEVEALRERACGLAPYTYLKLRHHLVELRREQYTLKDTFSTQIQRHSTRAPTAPASILIGEDVEVLPLGVVDHSRLSEVLFREDRYPEPDDLDEELQKKLTEKLWKKPVDCANTTVYFNFGDEEHLYRFVEAYEDLVEEGLRADVESIVQEFVRTFEVYASLAQLSDIHRLILRERLHHRSNSQIQEDIYAQFGKKYTLNYLSTIYHKNILGEIARTARRHREVVENLFFEENFKTCIDCGKTLLRDEQDWVRRKRVKDGFSCRCKACEKILRDKRKEEAK